MPATQEAAPVKSGGKFFAFEYNTRAVKSSIIHFQVSKQLPAVDNHCQDEMSLSLHIFFLLLSTKEVRESTSYEDLLSH